MLKIKINKIFLVSLITTILLFSQILLIKNILNVGDEKQIYVFSKNINSNTKIEENMIIKKDFKFTSIPFDIINNKNEIIGKYTKDRVLKGDFIHKNQLSDKIIKNYNYNIEKGFCVFSLKFEQGDSSIGWNLEKESNVNLLFVPIENYQSLLDKKIFKNLKILDIKDQNFNSIGEMNFDKSRSYFIVFKTKEKDTIEIISLKDKGKLELFK